MKIKEGYIDLDDMLLENDIKLENKSNILVCNGKYFFYKKPPYTTPYAELLAEELLKDLHIPCAEYRLAILNNEKGVISKDTHISGFKYINGQSIVDEYKDALELERYSREPEYNSLETIWDALDYRYKDKPNREEIVHKIMDKLVNLFIFDLLTAQHDRNLSNFEIMESDDLIDLAPVYDNEGIVHLIPKSDYISMVTEEETNHSTYEEVEKFINISDSEYYERFKNSLWIISPENLEEAFRKVEEKTKYKVDSDIKRILMDKFNKHRERVEEVLTKTRRR